MIVTSGNLVDTNINKLCEELHFLRIQNKDKYLSNVFCDKLDCLSDKIIKVVERRNDGSKQVKLQSSQSPEKISNDMVGTCLECVEMYLQKIVDDDSLLNDRSQTNCDAKWENGKMEPVFSTLLNIASDLKSLVAYLNFTLYANAVE